MEVVRELQISGRIGVRLDSGDLLSLSRLTRRRLDKAGLHDVAIVASGGLDEFGVKGLLDAGAPIDVIAVGTKVGASADAPALDSAYKLVEYAGRPVMKLSAGKITRPGDKQVFRSGDDLQHDLLAERSEPAPTRSTPLLELVMQNGRRVSGREAIRAARDRVQRDPTALPIKLRELEAGPPPAVRVSERLRDTSEQVKHQRRSRTPAARRED